jgi:hypothetical protein
MNSSQIDIYMQNLQSRLAQEEDASEDEDPRGSAQPSSSLDPFLNKLQAMLDEELSAMSSVSSCSIYLLSPLVFIVFKNSSRDHLTLSESDDAIFQPRKIPFSSSHRHPTPPSPSDSDSSRTSESDPSGDEYSHSSSHGSHLDPLSSDEEREDIDQIPLG